MNKKHSDRHYDVWEKKTRCSSELIDQSLKKGTAQKRERKKKGAAQDEIRKEKINLIGP